MKKSKRRNWVRSLGRVAKAMVLWSMLVSGLVLATHQHRAFSGYIHVPLASRIFHCLTN